MKNLTEDPADEPIEWPPAFKVKRHKRAKHIKLRSSPSGELQITLPYQFNIQHLPALIEKNKAWILKYSTHRKNKKDKSFPNKIEFDSLRRTYHITYEIDEKKPSLKEKPHHQIIVSGKIEQKIVCRKLLIAWIKTIAKHDLVLAFEKMSRLIKLPYSSVTIRDQKTMWGSCTTGKKISLNYKLLFLPKRLVHYIFIHELCHTIHMNHSIKFWQQVEKYDPNWKTHRKEMRQADDYIPGWI